MDSVIQFIEVRGARYRVLEMGQGAPMVWLHGFTGSAESWQAQLPYFARHYTVYAVDLLGHGETVLSPDVPARYAMAEAAQDLIALFDALALPPVLLFGYSMGGRLALYTALEYPNRVRALILASASPGIENAEERAARVADDNAFADRIERDGIVTMVDDWERLPLFATHSRLSDDMRAELRALRLRNRPQGLANSLRGMGAGAQPSLWARLGEWTKRTLLIAGEEDVKYVEIAHRMNALMPAAETVIVPNSGHTVHLEQVEAFQGAIASFCAARDQAISNHSSITYGA